MAKSNKAAAPGRMGADKLPKRIAGTKVPKRIRKSGLWAGWVMSPLGRELIASALVAAAAAIAGDKDSRGSKKQGAGRAGAGGSSRIAQTIADAAVDMVGRGIGGGDQAQATPPEGAASPKRKGNRKGRATGGRATFTH